MDIDLNAYQNEEGKVNMCRAYVNSQRMAEEHGIKQGIEKGSNMLGQLIDRLLKLGRLEDVQRVAVDEEYRAKLMQEYGIV